MPLHLRRSSVHHGAGEDSHDGRLRVEDSLFHDSVVLLDPNVERHIVVLSKPSQGMQQKNGVLRVRLL